MITVGVMAKTYGLLPSQIQALGTTYDLEVFSVLTAWEQKQIDKAQGKVSAPSLSQDEMKSMIDRVKVKEKQRVR
jgi:hypothetical protein